MEMFSKLSVCLLLIAICSLHTVTAIIKAEWAKYLNYVNIALHIILVPVLVLEKCSIEGAVLAFAISVFVYTLPRFIAFAEASQRDKATAAEAAQGVTAIPVAQGAADGADAADGAKAADGACASDGADAADGAKAADGACASDGPDAADGAKAADGACASDGADATDGAKAADGACAFDGPDAAEGRDGSDGMEGTL